MVEGTAFEKLQGRNVFVGSNPTLSAVNIVNTERAGFEPEVGSGGLGVLPWRKTASLRVLETVGI